MSNYLKQCLLLILIPSFLISCTEEPANAPGTDSRPPETTVDLNGDIQFKNFKDMVATSPDVFSYPGEIDGVGSEEQEALKLENIRKPIVYGIGAGGITMDTTYEESKTLLTPPFRGPFENGATLYNEQLYVVWKQEGDRKPQIIIPIKGYLGKMDGGKFGNLDFTTKFLKYKPDGQEGAVRLIQELYLELEQVEDESYNCLATGRCRLIYGDVNQPNFVMVLPGAVLLMAKEEFQIAEVRIVRDIDPGMLANNLDLLSGDVLIPEQAPFQLGQTHQEIFDRINASPVKSSPEVYVQTDSLVYAWNGVYLIFHRSNYDVDVTEAEPSDQNYAVQVTPEYPAYLTLDGKRILMLQDQDNISFALETMPDPQTAAMDVVNISATEVESKMTMNTIVRKQDSMMFARAFADFLAQQLSGRYDQVRYRMWGFQNDAKVNKEISVSLSAYNSEDLKGVSIGFEINEEQQKMNFMTVGLMDPEYGAFSKIVLPTSTEDVVRKSVEQPIINDITGDVVMDLVLNQPKTEVRKSNVFTELAGFKLNDLVKLEEIDALGRGEATVTYMSADPSLGEIKERAGYSDEAIFNFPQFNRPTPRQQGFISVYGASLGLKVIGADDTAQYARVVSISSGSMYGTIQDVCGMGSESNIKISMKDNEVMQALEEAVASKQAEDPDFQCEYFMVRDNGSLGIVKEIYFPTERMKFVFSGRALSAVTVYMPLSEVNNDLQGVLQ